MKLNALGDGEHVFIDANIFIYHFNGSSNECSDFLDACSQKKFTAFTSTVTLTEVCHRLMMLEAVSRGLIPMKQPSPALLKNPSIVKKLNEYYVHLTGIMEWGLTILSSTEHILIKSQIYRQRYGLLTNDSLIPAIMQEAGIINLASADKAFQTIEHLKVYSPTDL